MEPRQIDTIDDDLAHQKLMNWSCRSTLPILGNSHVHVSPSYVRVRHSRAVLAPHLSATTYDIPPFKLSVTFSVLDEISRTMETTWKL